MADVYLREHPNPHLKQYRSPRRRAPKPVIVKHTAESILDTIGPDTGAENVAGFISRRDTPGSYHTLVDADSIVRLVRLGDEAWHDATGSNPWSYGLSSACSTSDWVKMTPQVRTRFIQNDAVAAAEMARHCFAETGAFPLPRLITRAESEREDANGFITHALRDPKRRSDPGIDYPWGSFFPAYSLLIADLLGVEPTPPIPEPEPVPGGTDMAAAWRLPDNTVWACSGAGIRQYLTKDELLLRAAAGLITPVPKGDPNTDKRFPDWVRVAPTALVPTLQGLAVMPPTK